jgi:hypothetical protein
MISDLEQQLDHFNTHGSGLPATNTQAGDPAF